MNTGSIDNDLIDEVADYYSEKISRHGETAQGVDWNSQASQELRFEQLCRIINGTGVFSINDLGCGYGALLDYLGTRYQDFRYSGYDVSDKMVETASNRYRKLDHVEFIERAEPDRVADYGIASGIFNVRQQRRDADWEAYMRACLTVLNDTSQIGFAFNCLTSYSDKEKMKDYLYYADPCYWFDWCKLRFSNNIALLHDYNLYEFTILVRKQP